MNEFNTLILITAKFCIKIVFQLKKIFNMLILIKIKKHKKEYLICNCSITVCHSVQNER